MSFTYAVLARARLRSVWNGLFRVRGGRKLRPLLLLMLWGWMITWVGTVGYQIFDGLLRFDPTFRSVEGMTGAMMLGLFVVLFLGGSTFAISLFVLSGEIRFLLAAPVSRRAVFGFRLLETALLNGSFVFAFLLPMVVSLGIASSAPSYYYPIALVLAGAFLFLVTDLGTMLSFALGRVLPVKRARELLSALMGLSFLTLWIGLEWLRNRAALPMHPGPSHVFEVLGQYSSRLNVVFLPSAWFSSALVKLLRGELLGALGWTFVLVGLAIGLHLFTAGLADSLWMRGFAEAPSRARPKAVEHEPAFAGARRSSSVFLLREVNVLVRDYQQLMRVLLLAVFAIVFPLLSRQSGSDEGAALMTFMMPLIITALAGAQFASFLIPLEGRSFWLLKVAPGALRRVILAKWLVGSAATSAVLIVALGVASAVSGAVGAWALAVPACVFAGLAISAVGIWAGASFARFDWDHPRRALRSPGGLLLGLGGFAVLVLSVGPTLLAAKLFVFDVRTLLLLADLAALVTAVGAAVVCITPAIRRLQKLEWVL